MPGKEWQDDPVTKGELYDALLNQADRIEKRGQDVIRRLRRQDTTRLFADYVSLSLKMVLDLARGLARAIENDRK